MSTFALTFVLVLLVIALIAITWQGRAGQPHQPATLPVRTGRATRRNPAIGYPPEWAEAGAGSSPSGGRGRRGGLWGWLVGALGTRGPEPAVTGQATRIGAVRRLRSGVLLLALVAMLGLAFAVAIGLVLFLAGFFLELAVT